MIRRTSNSKADSSQLGLPFGTAAPVGRPPVTEPIAVRILEAVRLTGIGRSKLYELIASGEIETVKIGSCTLIPMASLHGLIERAKKQRL
jgi:excisionase family DNA binding protein